LGLLQQMGRNAPSLLVFQAKYNLAHTLSFLMHTQVERARQLYLDAIAVARNDASIPRTQLADCLSDYASLLAAEGQGREAEALQLEALATGRKEDPGGLWESQPLYALAVLRGTQGDPAGAKAYAAQMVEVATRTVGPDSAEAAQAKIVWAIPAARTGELDKAAKAVEEAMPVIQKRFASPSLDLWLALRNASGVTRLAGRYAEAERYARESLQVAEDAHMGRDDPRLGNSWEWLGEALCKENKSAEGIAALQQAQTIYRNAGAPWATTSARVSVRIAEVRAKTPQ
jgi:tetratricopeptide (TPR) repeat protein